MNVYDFDGTVYRGDSTVDFWLFCLRKKPGLVKYIGKQFAAIVLHLTGKIGTAELKSRFLCFLSSVDGEKMAEHLPICGFRILKNSILRQGVRTM